MCEKIFGVGVYESCIPGRLAFEVTLRIQEGIIQRGAKMFDLNYTSGTQYNLYREHSYVHDATAMSSSRYNRV